MTPNQVVAYNLERLRRDRGWTQEEASRKLERYLGVRWSKASFSAAERSAHGKGIRNFNANEIVALARTFEVPLHHLFVTPIHFHGRSIKIAIPEAGAAALSHSEMHELIAPEAFNPRNKQERDALAASSDRLASEALKLTSRYYALGVERGVMRFLKTQDPRTLQLQGGALRDSVQQELDHLIMEEREKVSEDLSAVQIRKLAERLKRTEK